MAATRLARPADLDLAVDVWCRANVARGKVPGPDRIDRVYAKLADPTALTIVAVQDDDIVGMALAEPGREHDSTGALFPELCHLSMLFVDPRHWGERIGQDLLDAVGETAVHCGHTQLQVWTGRHNHRALRLYQRAGFQPSGRTERLDTGEPVIHLARILAG